MTTLLRLAVRLVLLLLFAIGAAHAQTASAPAGTADGAAPNPNPAVAASPPAITPVQAQQALSVLQDDARRTQLIQVLQTIARAAAPDAAAGNPKSGTSASPPLTPAEPKPAQPKPAQPKPAQPKPAGPLALPLAPNSLGADVLTQASGLFSGLSIEAAKTTVAVTRFPLLWHWLHDTLQAPDTRARLEIGLGQLVLVLAAALVVEWLVARVTRRPLAALRTGRANGRGNGGAIGTVGDEGRPGPGAEGDLAAEEEAVRPTDPPTGSAGALRLMRRLPLALAGFVLELLPVIAFLGTAFGIATSGVLGDSVDTTASILALANAYSLVRIVMCGTRALVSPDSARLRLVAVSDQAAAYAEGWIRRLTVVAIFGGAIAEIASLFGLAAAAHDAFLKMVALVDHVFLAIIVLQCRQPVARRIAGAPGNTGPLAPFRHSLAATWHYMAIFYIAALWVVWAVEVRHGVTQILHLFFSTVAVLAVARVLSILALGLLERGFRSNAWRTGGMAGFGRHAERYHAALRQIVWAVTAAVTGFALMQVWGLNPAVLFRTGQVGSRLLSATVTIAVSTAVALAVWEFATVVLERHLAALQDDGHAARSARLRTLMPMLRTLLMIALLTVLGMTVLSEVGINIAPLLAGAGIIGVALGFGSQKLVQDFITGIFLLLENAMQVGDWVNVAGLSGAVETLSIRTIRLRAGDGSVHIIPFSSVTTVTNTNRGIGNAAVSVNVPYSEDTDRVGEALKEIASEMRKDPAYNKGMLGDLELWGVDKVDGAAVTIVGQIPCTDSARWGVQREFNRRLKRRFEDLGIEVAGPIQSIVLRREPKPQTVALPTEKRPAGGDGTAAMPDREAAERSTTVADSPPSAALSNKA